METQIVASFAQPNWPSLELAYNRSWLTLFIVTRDFDHSRHLIQSNKSISFTLHEWPLFVKSWIVHQFDCAQNSDFLFLESSLSFTLHFQFPVPAITPIILHVWVCRLVGMLVLHAGIPVNFSRLAYSGNICVF